MADTQRFLELAVHSDDIRVVFQNPFLVDHEDLVEALDKVLKAIEDAAKPAVTFDVSKAAYVSSVLLGWFFECGKAIRDKKGAMRITGASPMVHQSFHVVRLDLYAQIDPPVEKPAAAPSK